MSRPVMRLTDLSGKLTRESYFVLRKKEYVMMAYEPVFTAAGLPDVEHCRAVRLMHGHLDTLEYRALQSLINLIVKGKFDEGYLLCLPPVMFKRIVDKLTKSGVPHPIILKKILHKTTRQVNLSGYQGIPTALPILLHSVRNNSLTHLSLEDNNFLRDHMLRPLSDMNTLVNLNLAGCNELTNKLFQHIKGLVCLRWLSVARISKVSHAGVMSLQSGNDSPIEHFDLSQTSVDDKLHSNIFRVLASFSKLASLNLTSIKNLSHLESIEILQTLKRLVIRNLSLSPDALEHRLSKLSQLEHLDMHGVHIDPETSSCLQAVFDLPLLKTLDISVDMTLESAVSVAPTDPAMESINVTTLSLANNNWVDDRVLSGVLPSLNGLLELDLSNTRITSPCIAQLLPNMRHLTSLGLQGILLNDDDLIFLTELPNLKKLILSDTGVGDTLLVGGYINTCKELELVSLCRTAISDRGLANMKLSKLRTLWLDGCAVTIESVLSLSAYRCNNLTYLSVRKLVAVTDNLEEEIQAADVVDPD